MTPNETAIARLIDHEVNNRVKHLRVELGNQRGRVHELEEQLSAATAENVDVWRRNMQLSDLMARKDDKILELQREIDSWRDKCADLQRVAENLEQQLAECEAEQEPDTTPRAEVAHLRLTLEQAKKFNQTLNNEMDKLLERDLQQHNALKTYKQWVENLTETREELETRIEEQEEELYDMEEKLHEVQRAYGELVLAHDRGES